MWLNFYGSVRVLWQRRIFRIRTRFINFPPLSRGSFRATITAFIFWPRVYFRVICSNFVGNKWFAFAFKKETNSIRYVHAAGSFGAIKHKSPKLNALPVCWRQGRIIISVIEYFVNCLIACLLKTSFFSHSIAPLLLFQVPRKCCKLKLLNPASDN